MSTQNESDFEAAVRRIEAMPPEELRRTIREAVARVADAYGVCNWSAPRLAPRSLCEDLDEGGEKD